MQKLIEKIKLKTMKTALKFSSWASKKDKGEAGLIVAVALLVIAVLLVVVFREEIFARIQTGIANTGTNLDSIFAAPNP